MRRKLAGLWRLRYQECVFGAAGVSSGAYLRIAISVHGRACTPSTAPGESLDLGSALLGRGDRQPPGWSLLQYLRDLSPDAIHVRLAGLGGQGDEGCGSTPSTSGACS